MTTKKSLTTLFLILLFNIFLYLFAMSIGIGIFMLFGVSLIPLYFILSFIGTKIIVDKVNYPTPSSIKLYATYYIGGITTITTVFLLIGTVLDIKYAKIKENKSNQTLSVLEDLNKSMVIGNPTYVISAIESISLSNSFSFTIILPITLHQETSSEALNKVFEIKFQDGKVIPPKIENCVSYSGPKYAVYPRRSEIVSPGDYSLSFVYEYEGYGCKKEDIQKLKDTKFNLLDYKDTLIKTFTIDTIQ